MLFGARESIRLLAFVRVGFFDARLVFFLDVAHVDGRRGLVFVERCARRVRHFEISACLDALADFFQVVEIDVERRMILDELALVGRPNAHGAHHVGRIFFDARLEIIEKFFALREICTGTRVDDDAEVLQARVSRAHLVDRDHARRASRKELLEIALQVRVELDRAPRGGNREQDRDRPNHLSVAQRKRDERARFLAGSAGSLKGQSRVTIVRNARALQVACDGASKLN